MYGELLGSILFFTMILIQEDDYLKFTEDKIEHAGLLAASFGASRIFSYKCYSLFNPTMAFR